MIPAAPAHCAKPVDIVCVSPRYADAILIDGMVAVYDPDGSLKRTHRAAVHRLGAEIRVMQSDLNRHLPSPRPDMSAFADLRIWKACKFSSCSFGFGWVEADGATQAQQFEIDAISQKALDRAMSAVAISVRRSRAGPFVTVSKLSRSMAIAPDCANSFPDLAPMCPRPLVGDIHDRTP